MRMVLIAVCILVTHLPLPALAQDCTNAVSQAAMNACAAAEYKRSDAALNATYKELIRRRDGNDAAIRLLAAAQRAWLTFRDAECEFSTSGSEGGSVYPMLVSSCRAALTDARVEGLRGYLECQEGDLSCPVMPR